MQGAGSPLPFRTCLLNRLRRAFVTAYIKIDRQDNLCNIGVFIFTVSRRALHIYVAEKTVRRKVVFFGVIKQAAVYFGKIFIRAAIVYAYSRKLMQHAYIFSIASRAHRHNEGSAVFFWNRHIYAHFIIKIHSIFAECLYIGFSQAHGLSGEVKAAELNAICAEFRQHNLFDFEFGIFCLSEAKLRYILIQHIS